MNIKNIMAHGLFIGAIFHHVSAMENAIDTQNIKALENAIWLANNPYLTDKDRDYCFSLAQSSIKNPEQEIQILALNLSADLIKNIAKHNPKAPCYIPDETAQFALQEILHGNNARVRCSAISVYIALSQCSHTLSKNIDLIKTTPHLFFYNNNNVQYYALYLFIAQIGLFNKSNQSSQDQYTIIEDGIQFALVLAEQITQRDKNPILQLKLYTALLSQHHEELLDQALDVVKKTEKKERFSIGAWELLLVILKQYTYSVDF